MTPHPAADLFPLMGSDELLQLAEDIRAHGLLEPIVLHEGMVLDGRNRVRACELVGVEPQFITADLDGMTPTEWVVSHNLLRRHLTVAQRAALALDLLPKLEEEARERQGTRTDLATSVHDRTEVQRSDEKAASLVGVGRSTVAAAKAIAKRDPDVIERMRSGDVSSVAEAAREAGFEALAQGSGPPVADGVSYGKGDKFHEAARPLARYLAAWSGRNFEFRHVNPREAAKRLRVIDQLLDGLVAARADLEPRSQRAKLSV